MTFKSLLRWKNSDKNIGNTYNSETPDWVKKSTEPSKTNVKQKYGMCQIFLTVSEWPPIGVKNSSTRLHSPGRWKKNHPTKAHTQDNRYQKKQRGDGKRKSFKTSPQIEKCLKVLEKKVNNVILVYKNKVSLGFKIFSTGQHLKY